MKRKFLTELGITDSDVIKQIIDFHQGVVTDLKEDIAAVQTDLKTARADLKTAQTTIETLESAKPAESSGDGKDWKAEHDKVKGEFDTYKQTIATEKTISAQDRALHEVLKAAGANEKFISLVIDKMDKSKAVFDGDIEKGFTVKNGDDIVKPVKEQYGDIFGVIQTIGAGAATPPKGETAKATGHKDMNAFIRGVAE